MIAAPTRYLAVTVTLDHADPRATDDVGDDLRPLLHDARLEVARAAPGQPTGVRVRLTTSVIGPGGWRDAGTYEAAVDECDRIAAWIEGVVDDGAGDPDMTRRRIAELERRLSATTT